MGVGKEHLNHYHPLTPSHFWCSTVYMELTNIDIHDQVCAKVMRRYRLTTEGQDVNFAMTTLVADAGSAYDYLLDTEVASVDEARALRGSGWNGDLEVMRSNRSW